MPNREVGDFLKDIKYYNFHTVDDIDLFIESKENRVFFDIDSIWNSPLKREILYPKLKQYNVKICNFIYDLIPIKFPQFLYEKTQQNFTPYLKAVYSYSDLVFVDSFSAQNDFLNIQKAFKYTKKISTNVVYLGSDFSLNIDPVKDKYFEILSSQYILFVGTLEPRKEHSLVLKSFEELYEKNQNLKLVFIGKVGWNIKELLKNLNSHRLLNKNIFHYENIDDNTLNTFYQNAFLVTYLSKYEGYGLPVAESLSHGNITIISKNSSLIEIGGEFVDYIEDSSQKELLNTVLKYMINKTLYNQKKNYIKKNYSPVNWDITYSTLLKNIKKL